MAGLEERLRRLEGILNNLFCCDTNQFTGPKVFIKTAFSWYSTVLTIVT